MLPSVEAFQAVHCASMVPVAKAFQAAHCAPMVPFQEASHETALVHHVLGKALVFDGQLEYAKLDLKLPSLHVWAEGTPPEVAAADLVHHTCHNRETTCCPKKAFDLLVINFR